MKPRVDENLVYRITELVEEDLIVEDYAPFAERLVEVFPTLIAKWKDEGTYQPFSANVLCNLLGLMTEDFVNGEELDRVAEDERIAARVDERGISDLLQLVSIIDGRARDLIRIHQRETAQRETQPAKEEDNDFSREMASMERDRSLGRINAHLQAVVTGCRLAHHLFV